MRNIFFPHYLSGEPILALKIFPGHTFKVILVAGSKKSVALKLPLNIYSLSFCSDSQEI